ncbi:MAG: bifunctional protein PyrR [Chitinophagales bacterium]|nr:MAG: bifunctional protein PyrR [Chitinophagales bacterium]
MLMMEKGTRILTHSDIEQKVRRMSYQILENNYDEKELHIIGIRENGYLFADKIYQELKSISSLRLQVHAIAINKQNPAEQLPVFDFNLKDLRGKTVLLVDDVGNTGRTLSYALRPLLEYMPRKIEIAVLVDRQHKLFPIRADYVGLSLATTMKEVVTVQMGNREDAAYLS